MSQFMEEKSSTLARIIDAFGVIVIAFVLGLIIGGAIMNKQNKQEAINAGVAEYNGTNSQFQWKTLK